MATVDFSSFKEIVVPPIYVEQIAVHDASAVTVESGNFPGRRFVDRTGKTSYSIAIGASQQKVENKKIIDLETDLFFMLDEPTFETIKGKSNINVYMLAVEDETIINYIKSGDFTFGKIESLITEGRIAANTVNITNFLENRIIIENEQGTRINKLVSKIKVQVEQSPNLACFFISVLDRGSASSLSTLGNENNLYGRMIGEIVFDNGQIPTDFYYFQNADDSIWAGPVFRKEIGSSNLYLQGLKDITGSESKVTRQISKAPKIIDTRTKNTKNLFSRAVHNFFKDASPRNNAKGNKNASGVSPIFSSMTKKKDTANTTTISHISNTVFLNVLQILKDNSIYSRFLDGLEQEELLAIVNDTFIRNVTVHRRPEKKSEGDKNSTIINVSFMPGSSKFQASTVTTTDYNLTSDSKNVNFVYLEEEQNNDYGPAFRDYRVVTFIDNVDNYFTKSDFRYHVEIRFEDGIVAYSTKKIEAFRQTIEKAKFVYSQLLSPTFTDENGAFTDKAKQTNIDNDLAAFLSDLIDILFYFFKFERPELTRIYKTLYATSNTKTGKLDAFEDTVSLFENLYLFLQSNLAFAQEATIGAPDSSATSGKKKNKFFQIAKNSPVINMNLERTFGVNYHPSDNSFFNVTNDIIAPVYAPSITLSLLNKTIRDEAKFYGITGDFTKVDDRFTHHRPVYVHSGKDHDVREPQINIKEKQGPAMMNYYSSLFNKVSLKTNSGGNTVDLHYDLSDNKETKNVSNINLDYTKRREMLTSFSDLNTTIEPKTSKAKIKNSDFKPKETTLFDAQGETKHSSITQNIDINTKELEMNFMSIIEAASGVEKSQKNSHAIVDKKKIPYQLHNLPKGSRNNARATSHDFFKFSMLAKFRALIGFEPVSMTPIFNDGLREADLKSIASRTGNKVFCKAEKIKTGLIKSPKKKEMTGKLMNEFFVVFDSDKDALNFEEIIDNSPVIAKQNVFKNSISIGLLQGQLAENNKLYDQQEKMFSNSIYVEQPKETKETRFDFLAKRPAQQPTRPSTITVTPRPRTQIPSGGF